MRRRAFTWAELLVVIAILAVLAAILFPVWARCSLRRTCGEQMQPMIRAAAMYAQDYDRLYPPSGRTCLDPTQPDGSGGCRDGAVRREEKRYGYTEAWQGGWLTALEPYHKNWSLPWCTHSEKAMAPRQTDPRSFYSGMEWLRSPERVRFPAQKVLILEAYSNHDRQLPSRFDDPPNPERRHWIGFVDGHAKLVSLSEGCSGSSHPACRGWESCLGPGANGNYVCSGYGRGVNVPDFP